MKKIVIGLGAEDRGDDAAGLEVARRVQNVEAIARTGGLDIIDLWDDTDEVIIVDAMKSGSAPGTIRRFDGLTDSLPARSFVTTHALGPAEAIELARALNRLPRKLTVYGIHTATTDLGASLSQQVEDAIERIVQEIEQQEIDHA